jgi:hypothetical protein
MSLALSSLSLNSPTAPSRLPTPTPSPPAADRPSPFEKPVQGLLIPTDRSREELEEKWLPKIGRLRVEKEVVLPGYSLYFLRTWYIHHHSDWK